MDFSNVSISIYINVSLQRLKMSLTLQSEYFRTALVSLGHIAYLCPDLFGMQIKSIVSKVVVKDLLMVDFVSIYLSFLILNTLGLDVVLLSENVFFFPFKFYKFPSLKILEDIYAYQTKN